MMGSIFSCWKVTSTTSFVNCLLVSFAINLLCLIDDLCICLLFSHSVVSDSLQLHGLQHSRLPCPSPSPGACSNSCPSSQWCHPTISSLCWPLLLLPSIFPSIRVFSNEPALPIRWPKYWSLSFSNSPSNEYFKLVSSNINWFDLLAVQGMLKSLLQDHSSKASTLKRSAFFISPALTSIHDYWENHSLN